MNTFFLRSLFLLFLCLCIQNISYADHIVGGELQLTWTGSGTMYEVRLNIYVNQISIENAQRNGYNLMPPIHTVHLTDSLVNSYQFIKEINLPLIYNNPIETNNKACATNSIIRTNLLIYSSVVDLKAALGNYSDADYYITFQQCCRNTEIINLSDPTYQSFALYLKCPPLIYQNSSPSLNLLKNEYFCTNTLNTFDMSGTDNDGDRIEYSLVDPLRNIVPKNFIRPVSWLNGAISGSDPIPGSQPLRINSSTGLLTFNPSAVGVYCFGILIQEYRSNIKIGEVRKDYQFNVQNCPVNYKPVISFTDNSIKENDTLTVQLKGSTCFPIFVTDFDATKFFISETIFINKNSTLNANSTNTAYPSAGFTMPSQVPLTGFRDTARFDACFDPCAGGLRLDQTAYYPFKIIINDDRCPAKYDTLIFTIKVEVDANKTPALFIDPASDPKHIKVYEALNFKVYGSDVDAGDLLSLRIDNPQRGMLFTNVQDSSSTISSGFSWTPGCNDLYPGTYDVYFIIADNSCLLQHSDTVKQSIIVEQDEVSFDGMQVTNLITPNGDGLNDYYHIPGIPIGNCDKYFKGIEIYNRWGSRVFYSEDRLFKWYPDVSDGMYYFSIDLNYEVRKGWLQITE